MPNADELSSFLRHKRRHQVLIGLMTFVVFVVAYVAAQFVLLLHLFGRSIHGPPPPLIVLAIPLAVAAVCGGYTFRWISRFLARRQ